MSGRSRGLKVGIIVGIAIAFIACIVIVISFSYVEYYEISFKRQKSTGSVDTTTVYDMGRYFMGPDFEFKAFPADAHFVELNEVSVFLSDKLEVDIDVTFQYFLRKDELSLLHKTYDINYKDIVKSKAVDAIKGAAPSFSTREMIDKRGEMEAALFKAVRERLGGKCCRPDCKEHIYACPAGCISNNLCKESDKGVFLDVKYFQLAYTDIPSTVEDEYLTALTLLEDATREKLIQQAKVIRKNTTAMVKSIQNDAREITENAEATSELIRAVSRANYSAILENARAQGLKDAFSILDVKSQDYKNSIDYLRTLKGKDNMHFTVDFQQRIVGNLGK